MRHTFAFLLAAGIAIFGALIHFVAPAIGPDWYAYLHSPQAVVASAAQGTWLAPLGAVAIGLAMLAAGLYALSGAGLIRRLPLTKTALVTLASLCVVRGLLVIPALILVPHRIGSFDLVAAMIWLLAGLGFLYGSIGTWQRLCQVPAKAEAYRRAPEIRPASE